MYLAPCESGQVYLGMIIPIPTPYAQELSQTIKTEGIRPHVTILEPRPVWPDDIKDIQAQAEAICQDFSPFVISFGNVGDFRPVSPVVYIEVQRGHEACKELAKRLRFGPLAGPSRFPYYPHITLGTNVTDQDLSRVADLSKRWHGYFMVNSIDFYLIEPGKITLITKLVLGKDVAPQVGAETNPEGTPVVGTVLPAHPEESR